MDSHKPERSPYRHWCDCRMKSNSSWSQPRPCTKKPGWTIWWHAWLRIWVLPRRKNYHPSSHHRRSLNVHQREQHNPVGWVRSRKNVTSLLVLDWTDEERWNWKIVFLFVVHSFEHHLRHHQQHYWSIVVNLQWNWRWMPWPKAAGPCSWAIYFSYHFWAHHQQRTMAPLNCCSCSDDPPLWWEGVMPIRLIETRQFEGTISVSRFYANPMDSLTFVLITLLFIGNTGK